MTYPTHLNNIRDMQGLEAQQPVLFSYSSLIRITYYPRIFLIHLLALVSLDISSLLLAWTNSFLALVSYNSFLHLCIQKTLPYPLEELCLQAWFLLFFYWRITMNILITSFANVVTSKQALLLIIIAELLILSTAV